jgi:DNA-binding MarR family transcriptional regulator
MARKPERRLLTVDDLERVAELRIALRRFETATDRVTSRHGLTPRQYDLLAILHAPSRTGVVASAIADELSLSRNAMTELVSRAVQAGLVCRKEDARDARRKPLAPTARGGRRYKAAARELRLARGQLLDALRRAAREVERSSPGTNRPA